MITTVVHCKRADYDVYIGRQKTGFHFGNPFGTKEDSLATVLVPTRTDAIESFDKWLSGEEFQNIEPERRQWILENLHLLKGKRLGCFCKPKSCHGDVYVKHIHVADYLEF